MAFLKKRGNNYYLYWYEGKKQRAKSVGSDYLAAENALKNKRREVEQRGPGFGGQMMWKVYCGEYLIYSKNNKGSATYLRDLRTINTFNKLFTPVYISDISASTLESYKQKRLTAGILPNSINRELITLKSMVNRAAELSYIYKSPSKMVKYLKITPSVPRFLTREEYKELVKVSYEPFKTAIMIATFTGMRSGEVRNLTWNDVNFDKGHITVSPKNDWKPKDNEIRHIPMTASLASYLSQKPKVKWVIAYENGERPGDQVFNQLMRRIFNKAGLRDCSFHTLRHTFASWLRLKGINLDVIGELLGHADFETTKIYAHITPELKQNVVNLLD